MGWQPQARRLQHRGAAPGRCRSPRAATEPRLLRGGGAGNLGKEERRRGAARGEAREPFPWKRQRPSSGAGRSGAHGASCPGAPPPRPPSPGRPPAHPGCPRPGAALLPPAGRRGPGPARRRPRGGPRPRPRSRSRSLRRGFPAGARRQSGGGSAAAFPPCFPFGARCAPGRSCQPRAAASSRPPPSRLLPAELQPPRGLGGGAGLSWGEAEERSPTCGTPPGCSFICPARKHRPRETCNLAPRLCL